MESFDVWGRWESIEDPEVVRSTGLVCLRGRSLREAALAVLLAHAGAPVSIRETLEAFDRRGCEVMGGHPEKTLSDGLRYEMSKGRALRVSRGVYRINAMPRTTAWRIRRRWGLRCWADARWHPHRTRQTTKYTTQWTDPPAIRRLVEERYPQSHRSRSPRAG